MPTTGNNLRLSRLKFHGDPRRTQSTTQVQSQGGIICMVHGEGRPCAAGLIPKLGCAGGLLACTMRGVEHVGDRAEGRRRDSHDGGAGRLQLRVSPVVGSSMAQMEARGAHI
ncbi:hypothetical protein GGX14DRAFT_392249 [Mycena pura]|uniref:Uncharacterized protein n=1 Tax=Mycena pura TaxID=153505 RepID=A0AAD6VKR5_9AGAR|nr:hypothetical protein GGX14DRAFT_392249 [Mycena pura]